jgi:excinuclease ABC subunit A
LIDKGHSIVVIEHNLDVVKCADWVIDLGPEGGDGGGELMFAGTPEDMIKKPVLKKSVTAQFLKEKI